MGQFGDVQNYESTSVFFFFFGGGGVNGKPFPN